MPARLFARLTHLYPALYVDHATKKQHFPKVRQLLNFAELASAEMSDSQLSRELGEFKACYPNTTAEIIARFNLIENGDIEYRCKGYVIWGLKALGNAKEERTALKPR